MTDDRANPGSRATTRAASGNERDDDRVHEYRGTGVFWMLVLFFVPLALLIIMLAQNADAVPFDFLWLNLDPPLFVVILVAALVGAAITEGLAAAWRHQRRRVRTERDELQHLRSRSQT
jgi:uncharacterized integral membrane protein